jgi:serine/threonine-protein kinase
MNTEIPHPDTLGPGDLIGSWRILEVLGAGGLGRVFKVERDGRAYALKMALRLPGQRAPGEEDVDGRCTREATGMLERTPHPHIPRVLEVSRWPDPEAGFLFMVMEYVEGWRFTEWRDATHPTAARLVDVLLPLVRTLAELHEAGILHRDLNANNVLIRREDDRPFLLDFGSASLPGARTLTRGLPPVDLSVVPPEALEHIRRYGDTERFEASPQVDLYGVGVLMYQALTDGYPFNPELPPTELLASITLRMPRAPHRVNPKVPESLSAITLRLLAKRPEDRYASAEALHQALWEANKERSSQAWKVPLDLPESGPAPVSDEEHQELRRDAEQARRAAAEWARVAEADPALTEELADDEGPEPPEEEGPEPPQEAAEPAAPDRGASERGRHPLPRLALACALVVGLVALVWWWSSRRPDVSSRVASPAAPLKAAGQEVAAPAGPPDAEKVAASSEAAPSLPSEETPSMKPPANEKPRKPSTALRAARKVAATAATCSALAGCPAPQVVPTPDAPPPPEECPRGAQESMAKWGIKPGSRNLVLLSKEADSPDYFDVRAGPIRYYVSGNWNALPQDTILSGRLILADRAYVRLTQAHPPSGDTFPVCVELWDEEGGRGVLLEPDGPPNGARIIFNATARAVRRFE